MAGEVFISYRRSDEPKARLLFNLLAERGVSAWYDANVRAGEDWRAATAKALEAAPIFVLLYSKAASESDEITKELAVATFQKKKVIPVRLENIPPIGPFLYELASRNWFDAFAYPDSNLTRLADHIAEIVRSELPASSVAAATPAQREPQSGERRRYPPWLLAAAGGAAALLAAVLLVSLWPRGSPEPPAPSTRVAFFGFTAPDGDAPSMKLAAEATDATFA